ncbi:hypothetical protein FOA43_000605 [Brettanomyces nanus]|uniref:Uncharacterized protein n=1 Tax=Eeniella nana TaxID=13502 RepID=A0A875RZ17_EENNA|nr:uncharacterized protein FOA43_000605 [Brettanomyces nanus]QPG73295.1 hypothetical protein FOA43_000605 [Brettanomyces nanus]
MHSDCGHILKPRAAQGSHTMNGMGSRQDAQTMDNQTENSGISDELLASIVKLSTLQETADINHDMTDTNTKGSTGVTLLQSPIKKTDSRVVDSLESKLSRLIARLSEKKEKSDQGDVIKMLKMCLIKIKQLNMTLNFVKEDNASKIDRLELERDLLFKEIGFIKHKSYRLNTSKADSTQGDATPGVQGYVTPITTPHRRRIQIIRTARLNPGLRRSRKAHHGRSKSLEETSSDYRDRAGHKKNSLSLDDHNKSHLHSHSHSQGTQFFHYYSNTNSVEAGDFNSVDNRRNKKRRDGKLNG